MSDNTLHVVLDLDEVLVHSIELSEGIFLSDLYGAIGDNGFFSEGFFSTKRPFAKEFIQKLLLDGRFSVSVWTSANFTYAKKMFGEYGFKPSDFNRFWTRDNLLYRYNQSEGHFGNPPEPKKAICKLRRSLKSSRSRIVAIDDTASFWSLSRSNLIPVPKYLGNQDLDLNKDFFDSLFSLLEELHESEDVRNVPKFRMVS